MQEYLHIRDFTPYTTGVRIRKKKVYRPLLRGVQNFWTIIVGHLKILVWVIDTVLGFFKFHSTLVVFFKLGTRS